MKGKQNTGTLNKSIWIILSKNHKKRQGNDIYVSNCDNETYSYVH